MRDAYPSPLYIKKQRLLDHHGGGGELYEVFNVILNHASVDVEHKSGLDNQVILLLSVTCKWLRSMVLNKYHPVKSYYAITGSLEATSNMGTQWLYVSKAVDKWSYTMVTPYLTVDVSLHFVFVCDDRQLAVFYHVNGHSCTVSQESHKSGIPSLMQTNWEAFSNGEAKEFILEFSK